MLKANVGNGSAGAVNKTGAVAVAAVAAGAETSEGTLADAGPRPAIDAGVGTNIGRRLGEKKGTEKKNWWGRSMLRLSFVK